MKLKILALLIILTAGTVGIFGFLGMHHGNSDHIGCIAATAKQMPCPHNNPIAFVNFHQAAFNIFSQTLPGVSMLIAIMALLALFIGLSSIFSKDFQFDRQVNFTSQKLLAKTLSYKPQSQFLSWLALHEKRDPHAIKRVYDELKLCSAGVYL